MTISSRFGVYHLEWHLCAECIARFHGIPYLVSLPARLPVYIGSFQGPSSFCQGLATIPKVNGNEIRPGYVLEHDNGLWAAVKVNHVKPGKGGAFAQVELKNLRDGRKLNERFRSEDKVERVTLENKDQQFLYENDGMLVFMDNETYEQIELPADLLGDRRPFLQDGMIATVEYFGDEALSMRLPQKVRCRIAETEPVQKGQTAANSFKPAILDNGVRIMIPPFIGPDEEVIVHTELMEYSERA
jgi:elongation factor P